MAEKLLDPRQKACWENFINPNSPTFANQRQSAIAAGYTELTADKVADQEWFAGRLRRLNMRMKAEKVLNDMLELDDHHEEEFRDKEGVVTLIKRSRDSALTRIKQDTAKFTAERLGKEDWANRTEVAGPDGGPVVDAEKKQKSNSLIKQLLHGIRNPSDPRGD